MAEYGTGNSSTRNLWAGVANDCPLSPASPQCTIPCGLADEGAHL